jgi:hypothetical protein
MRHCRLLGPAVSLEDIGPFGMFITLGIDKGAKGNDLDALAARIFYEARRTRQSNPAPLILSGTPV